jgi:uncharacterized protein (TIGR00369 family)
MAQQEITLELAEQVLKAQPFSVFVGAQVVNLTPGAAILQLTVKDHHKQQNGFLDGGMISYLADNALTFAGGSVLGPAVLTAGFSIEYLRPVRGPLVQAVAEVADSTSRNAVCRCRIVSIDESGDVIGCAFAQGTIRAFSK